MSAAAPVNAPVEGAALGPRTFAVTRADLRAYADASGDHNPIHLDEAVALSVGLPGVIAHGMYTMALMARAVTDWFPGAEVREIGSKFTDPVVVPAEGSVEVVVSATVKSVAEEDGRCVVALALLVTSAGAKVLGMPKAVVVLPAQSDEPDESEQAEESGA
ncbi:MaoC/PaaZ C-terminal domain-containing protein [Nocardioides jishulii]|uniref:Acyl dehydratase n=1 Tax=Nocardioides jishulii TaxID=2575440 RepID=A0A4U2YTT0_9ACTN|nr:MaoC/PaaZ C-terminal domain-containing protein [Nocardioides jishulii]QCX28633.1 acyl dehydratase [Nocardioides jishulii]TKI64474.1 acyl dehydratase [Nocardioides jishulii]